MLTGLISLAAGLAILTLGGHAMVRGAVSVALLARVTTAVVGLTIVAFGTSLPELAVSLNAAARGATDIAYANVVGSSIFNLAVILAVAALVRPVIIQRETRRFEYPGMLLVLALCLFMARDRLISQPEGGALLAGLGAFLVFTVARTRWNRTDGGSAEAQRRGTGKAHLMQRWARGLGLVTLGAVSLWIGSDFMVRGAVTIAEAWGVSERIIGLTVIAMGTSLPELVTSGMAALHGEGEIALSNLMGSNIFNILAVLGGMSLLFPVPVHARAASLDNWVMLGFGAALLPILWMSPKVTRVHGTLLLAGFAVYLGVLIRLG